MEPWRCSGAAQTHQDVNHVTREPSDAVVGRGGCGLTQSGRSVTQRAKERGRARVSGLLSGRANFVTSAAFGGRSSASGLPSRSPCGPLPTSRPVATPPTGSVSPRSPRMPPASASSPRPPPSTTVPPSVRYKPISSVAVTWARTRRQPGARGNTAVSALTAGR